MQNGVPSEGERSCRTHVKTAGTGVTAHHATPGLRQAAFALRRSEKQKRNGTCMEGKRTVQGKVAGSLSILIVPSESRRTLPKKPVSREGGCRITDLLT